MKQEFIKINNTIQDYDEYIKNIILLKNYLRHQLKDLMSEEGFELKHNQNQKYHSASLEFYNHDKDLEIQIFIRKKNNELLV